LTEEITRQNLQERNEKAKLHYDRNATDSSFSLGEKVLLYDPTTKSNECRKLKRRWVGPFLLTDRSDDGLTYGLKDCQTGKLKRYNDDRDDFLREKCDNSRRKGGRWTTDSRFRSIDGRVVQYKEGNGTQKGKREGLLPSCVGGRYASMASIGRCH